MDFWRNNTIWFDEVPEQLFRNINLKEEKMKEITIFDIEYLILSHHKQNKLGNFVDIPESLLYLELNWSNIQNFIGIEKLNKLKRLELHYCTRLESDIGLSTFANTLEHLHINQSKKFFPTKELLSSEFPNLIDFRFFNTNVIEGDLTPILKHPSIRSVGFLNKRHYNVSEN